MSSIQFFLLSNALFGTTSFILFILFQVFGRNQCHRIWSFFNLAVAWWGFGLSMTCLTNNSSVIDFWWKFSTIGGVFIPTIFYHFTLSFLKMNKKRLAVFFYCQSVLVAVLVCLGIIPFGYQLIYENITYVKAVNWTYHIITEAWAIPAFFGHFLLFRSIKRTSPDKKIQIKYLLCSLTIGFIAGGITHFFNVYGFTIHPATNIFITFYSLITSYAIFRHRLFSIDFAVRKGLVYTLLLSLVTALYFLIIIFIEKLFQNSAGYSSPIASFFIVVLVIFISEPLRHALQSVIDYHFFKGSLIELSEEKDIYKSKIFDHERMKTISTLAAGMAHEIKNPLTSIKTFAEFLPKKYDDPEFRTKFSKLVVDEVDRVSSIVQQLLDFSKPAEPELKSSNISEILDDTLALLTSNLFKARVELVKSIDPMLSAMVDKNQLKQALLNLVLNSIQSMPIGGTLTITAKSLRAKTIAIAITDTGAGINKEHLPHIFDPFYTTKEAGSGLGLAIVHGIITKHGGKIDVQSTVGVGTTVTITLKRYLPN